ncbi:hypothetical protein JOD97_004065 [Duganella sp. 1411]|jgi:hypothetical protein|uniref:hypothetical protein n=1 Tax=unclassified Duganella TaxID=2636909 RepID=UPI001AE74B35|nr:hypothetical protein [Duganella sp. 1411]MBP1206003.1 hypothetical protein [Duganella sp. 1411]
MEYSDLSIAIQIRTLAAIRQAETLRARGHIAPDSAEARKWTEENPLLTFVPQVIQELRQITEILKQEY